MLVSNLAFSRPMPLSRPVTHRAAARPTVGSRAMPALVLWLAAGSIVVLFVPAVRADRFFGATLWFWLVGAPAINLLWWRRRTGLAGLRACLSMLHARAARPRRQAVLRPTR